MRFSKLKNLLLLAYLLPLLCLGQSLHHADFIGLHHHHVAEQAVDDSECGDSAPVCSCQMHQLRKRDGSLPQFSEKSEIADEHCALCQFFDDYHVVVACFEVGFFEDILFLPNCEVSANPVTRVVSSVARGPPAV